MIRCWRKAWGQGDFAFLFVQLAGYQPNHPLEFTAWGGLRDAQRRTLAEPKTGMGSAIDVGDVSNIHPKDKESVGVRLALAAEEVAYGQKVVGSGPLVDTAKADGGKLTVRFTSVGGGLVVKGDALTGFFVAGADGKLLPAQAQIQGDTVVVTCAEVSAPTIVTYAINNSPACTLYNKEGLPASPFRVVLAQPTTAPAGK